MQLPSSCQYNPASTRNFPHPPPSCADPHRPPSPWGGNSVCIWLLAPIFSWEIPAVAKRGRQDLPDDIIFSVWERNAVMLIFAIFGFLGNENASTKGEGGGNI